MAIQSIDGPHRTRNGFISYHSFYLSTKFFSCNFCKPILRVKRLIHNVLVLQPFIAAITVIVINPFYHLMCTQSLHYQHTNCSWKCWRYKPCVRCAQWSFLCCTVKTDCQDWKELTLDDKGRIQSNNMTWSEQVMKKGFEEFQGRISKYLQFDEVLYWSEYCLSGRHAHEEG